MKRTPQNCTVADRVYSRDGHDRYVGDKCAGVRIAVGWDGDEPIETCKRCKHFYMYDEDEDTVQTIKDIEYELSEARKELGYTKELIQ